MDKFLDFSKEEKSCLHKLKLSIRKGDNDQSCVTRWIDFAATPKLNHLDVKCLVNRKFLEEMPLSLYICETLLYLSLHQVLLGTFESVSLPCLKTMCLEDNIYASDAALESIISSCPVLEDLSIVRMVDDNIMVLRVHSQTLTSLNIEYYFCEDVDRNYVDFEDSGVLIDAPRLKYLNLEDGISWSKIINNSGSLAKVNFGDLYLEDSADEVDFHIVRSFFTSISGVRDIKIGLQAFEFIKDFMPLPQFCNLSCLEVEFYSGDLETLLMILQSCPNLKSLVLSVFCAGWGEQMRVSIMPWCLLSSLEYVKIDTHSGNPIEMELARFFTENCVILKKLVLRSRGSASMLEDLLALPRRSSTCQIEYVEARYVDI